ncbi:hypothetical protein RS030_142186 [Cryptosporidium xiaoi]|uniref:Uncharacterized protein n=1 Tax=Cryptosporidium xiaoi TaxID=659607 RepID=A0AAV9Y322_9CRYT
MRLLVILFIFLYSLNVRNAAGQINMARIIGKNNKESDLERDRQQTSDQDGAELALFEIYSNALKYILEGMFGSEYSDVILKSNDTNNLPLCSSNDQMIDKGCNVMMYSCTSHLKNKYLCYFYYWSFCRCSRPWSIGLLNYLIPPVYDCYPSIATDEDFLENQEFLDDSKTTAKTRKESKFLKTLPDDMEIPVGKCGLNVIFVVWIIAAFLTITWIIYRFYLFSCYIKANITANRKNR